MNVLKEQGEFLKISREKRTVRISGIRIHLSANEFELLFHLVSYPEYVFTKEQLYQSIYHEEPVESVDNIIYCLIRSLRKKLEPDPRHPKYIHTVKGVGYKFEVISEE